MSKKQKKVCRTLNYSGRAVVISDYDSISALASLVGVLAGIANAAVVLKICALTEGIKKYKSIIKKKNKKDDKTVLLLSKLITIEVLLLLNL